MRFLFAGATGAKSPAAHVPNRANSTELISRTGNPTHTGCSAARSGQNISHAPEHHEHTHADRIDPFATLHVWQHGTRFRFAFGPFRERGTMWSTVREDPTPADIGSVSHTPQ